MQHFNSVDGCRWLEGSEKKWKGKKGGSMVVDDVVMRENNESSEW